MPRTISSLLTLVLLASTAAQAEQYAFIVGIGGYDEKQLDPLGDFPRNDAIALRDLLLESGFKSENVVLMVDDLEVLPRTRPAGRYLPEAEKIRRELQLLLPALERDDSLIVALAGHGIQFRGDDEPYFCPLDAQLDDKSTLLSLTWLYDQLRYDDATQSGCKPRRKLLLIDACRNDPASRLFRDAGGGPGLASVSLPQLAPLPEGVVALFSCAEGQQALQHPPLKHGVFFYHVLEGLKGQADGDRDQKITLDELIAYTKSQTQTYARLKLAAPQTPRQKGYFDGLWELRSLAEVNVLTNSLGMKLKLIPAGEFLMGSPDSVEGRGDDEGPQHRVQITRPFYIGVYEVTRGQFAQFVREAEYQTEPERDGEGGWGWNESTGESEGRDPKYSWRNAGFKQTDEHPVVNVTWNDAIAFAEWLGRKEGRAYRLPTEAEWEYMACAGSTTPFPWGNSLNGHEANVNGNSPYGTSMTGPFLTKTTVVGRYTPNAWGLYDTVGNVSEWCSDWYGEDYYSISPERDPTGPSSGFIRTLRGGMWLGGAVLSRSANRFFMRPEDCIYYIGFRVVAETE